MKLQTSPENAVANVEKGAFFGRHEFGTSLRYYIDGLGFRMPK